MTLFLTGIAFSTAFLVTRSKTSMKSVSQTGHCPILAKEMLEQFASFGTRLYGYSYDGNLAHQPHHPKVRPLLIMPDTGASPPGIKDVAGHSRSTPYPSQLKFPGIFQNTLNDLSMTISPGSDGDWVNTGVDIIKMQSNKVELGSSIFIINTVNILQYLYNSDEEYFTGTRQGSTEVWGKMWSTMGSNSALEKYKKQYDLTDLKVYLLIRPVELDTGQHNVLTTEADVANKCQSATVSGNILNITPYPHGCPQDGSHYLLLTRPRLTANVIRKIPSYVILHGNPHLGFELKVTLEYQKSGSSEDLYCDTMQTFTHQMDSTDRLREPSPMNLLSLKNAAPTPRDLLATPVPIVNPENTTDTINKSTISSDVPELVSCDTDGTGYEDIILELDIGNLQADPNTEKGTLLLCQGISACVSGDGLQSYPGCSYQAGNWQRCHQVTFPGQTTTTKASLASNKLKLTFEDLPPNRRYDLNLAEMSMSGTVSYQKTIARFYLDAKRPEIKNRAVKGDDVGGPLDQVKGRDYQAHHKTSPGVSWNKPSDAVGGKWLQCNQADVEFTSQIEDQFMHNLRPCKRTAERKDGNGTTDQTSNLNTLDLTTNIDDVTGKDFKKCNGKYSSIQHGRQMMTLESYDSCQVTIGPPPAFKKVNEKKIEWDTDLPSTFAPQDFSFKTEWFHKTSGPSYTVDAVHPATGKGEFPKHYSMDCWEHYWGPSSGNTRPDGHDTTISCNMKTSKTDIDDGCNPNAIGIDYWHVCGGSKQNKEAKWAVYAPYSKSCQNVRCEPALICCDGTNGAGQTSPSPCGSLGGTSAKGKCERNNHKTYCSNPKGGGNSYQDNTSSCPPLGLYSCNYTFDCKGTSPFSKTDPASSSCTGVRENGSCSFTVKGTCTPDDTTWNSTCDDDGDASFPGTTYTKSCNSGCTSQDDTSSAHDCNCTNVMWDDDGDSNTPDVVKTTCVDDDGDSNTPCVDEAVQNCDTCYDLEYKAGASDYYITVSGTCKNKQGSCGRKTNLSISRNDTAEICEVASSNKTRVPAQSTAVDGDCGSNPTPHICVQGTAGAVSGSCTKTWTCAGSNGGSSTSCTYTEACCPASGTYFTKPDCQAGPPSLPANQVCVKSGQCWTRDSGPVCSTTAKNVCVQGTFTDLTDGPCTPPPPNNVNKQCYKWQCTNNGSTMPCETIKPGPTCGTDCLTCKPSFAQMDDSAVADTATHINWRCTYNGQSIDTCQAPKSSCLPDCDTTQCLGCDPGIADDNAVPDTGTHINWRCTHNGKNIDSCQRLRTLCEAKCDTTLTYGCVSPSTSDNEDDSLSNKWTWTCKNGNTNTSCFKCKDGYQLNAAGDDCEQNICACDSSKDSCGTPCTLKSGTDGAKNATQFKWACEGASYTDSGECTFDCPSTPTKHYTSKAACNTDTTGKPSSAICNTTPETNGCYTYTAPPSTCACNSSKDSCGTPCTLKSGTDGAKNATHFKWVCEGASYTDSGECTFKCPDKHYTSEANCNADTTGKPSNAICNTTPETNGCYTYTVPPTCTCDSLKDSCGTPCTLKSGTDGVKNATQFKWACEGANHTDSGECTFDCPDGQYTTQAACPGTCSLDTSTGCYPPPVNQCICDNSQADGCVDSSSTASQPPSDTVTADRWICKQTSWTDSTDCIKCKLGFQLNSAKTDCEAKCDCGSSKDTCTATCTTPPHQTPVDTATEFKWTCKANNTDPGKICTFNCPANHYTSEQACNANSGNHPAGAICRAAQEPNGCYTYDLPPSTCGCDTSTVNGCISSNNLCVADQIQSTPTADRWICKQTGWTDSPTCIKCKPGFPPNNAGDACVGKCTCDNSTKYGCGGTCTSDTSSLSQHQFPREWLWYCKKTGYTDSPICNKVCPATPTTHYTSEAHCNAAKPAGATCRTTPESNGCYTYDPPPSTCTCDNSTKYGCGNTCNPSNKNQFPREWVWSCKKPGYTDAHPCNKVCPVDHYTNNNDCVNRISNAQSCSRQANGCYALNTCRNGYIKEGHQCVSAVCNNSACSSCAGSSGTDSTCCSIGAFHGTPGDGDTQWNWQCRASTLNPVNADSCSCSCPPNHYTSRSACNGNKPAGATCNTTPESNGCYTYTTASINGDCGTTKYGCAAGTECCRDILERTIGLIYQLQGWTWTCKGENSGTDDDCTLCNTGYREVNGVCIPDSPCPSNKRPPHYKPVGGQCLPSCGVACNASSAEGTCASGTDCDDTINYDITDMGNVHDAAKCCKRKSNTQYKCSTTSWANRNMCGCCDAFRPDGTNIGTCAKGRPYECEKSDGSGDWISCGGSSCDMAPCRWLCPDEDVYCMDTNYNNSDMPGMCP